MIHSLLTGISCPCPNGCGKLLHRGCAGELELRGHLSLVRNDILSDSMAVSIFITSCLRTLVRSEGP